MKITLLNGTETEKQTRTRLEAIIQRYEKQLSKWTFKDEFVIQDEGFSNSHPVLTFASNQLLPRDDNEVLSIFIHENLHCFFDLRLDAFHQVMDEIRSKYPEVPVGRVNGVHLGAHDKESRYNHLVVCFLEHFPLVGIIGKCFAEETLARHDYYKWIYQTVLSDYDDMKAIILDKYDLNPLTLGMSR